MSPRRSPYTSSWLPEHDLGAEVPSQNPATSAIEQRVKQRLLEAGLPVRQGLAIQCSYDIFGNRFPVLTPDFVLLESKVCVEVDPLYTHGAREFQDTMRNALLSHAGWTVVRLRLGGQQPIGAHDVVAEGQTITDPVIEALVAAVTDAVDGRPGQVRRVARPTPRMHGRLSRATTRSAYEHAYFFAWMLDSGDPVRLAIVDSGRCLGLDRGRSGVWFLRLLDLHRLPRKQWKAELTAVLEQMGEADFEPTSAFPWGERFFTGPSGPNVLLPASFNLGGPTCELTVTVKGTTTWEPLELRTDGTPQLQVHPEAAAAGWRIAQVVAANPFLPRVVTISLARTGKRTGHWA
ncbi:hypothetical protein GCM10011374_34210 [Kocuria dechangensis]|uniref:DUF559 domain-containing protein n=1 Tax=Kocuria dechangensis TaxID=1176249 RepID=A0A917H4F6_9MICC|nr:DUF559 domain-containing protein [Kocuria dechangensis]GGG67159.1 hypothetical protein GCM10011374_34210 [Kocuria dechangensis]